MESFEKGYKYTLDKKFCVGDNNRGPWVYVDVRKGIKQCLLCNSLSCVMTC